MLLLHTHAYSSAHIKVVIIFVHSGDGLVGGDRDRVAAKMAASGCCHGTARKLAPHQPNLR